MDINSDVLILKVVTEQKGNNMDTIINRKELLEFWKQKGSPFMWEDIKNIARKEEIKTLDDLQRKLDTIKIKRDRLLDM